jgi:hypothetical protein
MCYMDYPKVWPGNRVYDVKHPAPPMFPWPTPKQEIKNTGQKPIAVTIGGATIMLAPGQSVEISGSGTI